MNYYSLFEMCERDCLLIINNSCLNLIEFALGFRQTETTMWKLLNLSSSIMLTDQADDTDIQDIFVSVNFITQDTLSDLHTLDTIYHKPPDV